MSTGHIQCPQCGHTQEEIWQFCHSCLFNIHYKSTNTITPPSWVQLQQAIMDPARMNPGAEIKAQEMVEAEKKKELATSKKAQSWEYGRKKEWKANKPYYLKQHGG